MKKQIQLFVFLFTTIFFMSSCEKEDLTKNILDLTCDVTYTDVTTFEGSDGTITVTIESGNPPYNFILNGDVKNTNSNQSYTFTSLTTGDYKVEVKDNENKTFTKNINIIQPNEDNDDNDNTYGDLVVNYNVIDNDNNNQSGVIKVQVTGGKQPYQFKLNDNQFITDSVFTNLSGGDYVITVKDDRDEEVVVDNISVNYGFSIDVDFEHSNTHTDNGGKITVTPTENYSTFTYKIDNGTWDNNNVFDSLYPGQYTVYAQDTSGNVREENVEIENNYNGYRIGDLYDKDGYVGRVFHIGGDDIKIADTLNSGWDMPEFSYNYFLAQMNSGGLNWETIDSTTLKTYLNVAKDYIVDGNVFNVEIDTQDNPIRYRSNIRIDATDIFIAYIRLNNNGIYEVRTFIGPNGHFRGRYVATLPNVK